MFILGKPEKQLKFLGAGPRAFWDSSNHAQHLLNPDTSVRRFCDRGEMQE
jgi:hypothetical protein